MFGELDEVYWKPELSAYYSARGVANEGGDIFAVTNQKGMSAADSIHTYCEGLDWMILVSSPYYVGFQPQLITKHQNCSKRARDIPGTPSIKNQCEAILSCTTP